MVAKYAGEHIICVVTGQSGAEIHHILTQKSHPELKDTSWNCLALCHSLHVLVHQKGLTWVSQEIPLIRAFLENNGWEFDEHRRKWVHPSQITETM